MTLGAAVLLGLALSAPQGAPPPRAPPAPARTPPPPPCTKYRVQVDRTELAPDDAVTGWTTAALERAALHDPRSACCVLVRITALPTRFSGKEDGWVAHVSVSTRRMQRDGRLLTGEKGKLFVESLREVVVWKARTFVEEYVASLAGTAPAAPDGAGEAPAPVTGGR